MNKCTCGCEEDNCKCGTVIHQDIVKEVTEKMLPDKTLIDMADFFKIFGDNTRLKIINVLINSKMCVCDIANVLKMSHSAISHQLIVLKQFKIVKYTKVGKVVYYELDDDHIKKVFDEGSEHINE